MARQVLDLDETLVHSTLDFGEGKPDFVFEVSLNNKKHAVNVRQRPHMAKFLERCSELFELVIFTASQKLYAEQLLNIIDPGRYALQIVRAPTFQVPVATDTPSDCTHIPHQAASLPNRFEAIQVELSSRATPLS